MDVPPTRLIVYGREAASERRGHAPPPAVNSEKKLLTSGRSQADLFDLKRRRDSA